MHQSVQDHVAAEMAACLRTEPRSWLSPQHTSCQARLFLSGMGPYLAVVVLVQPQGGDAVTVVHTTRAQGTALTRDTCTCHCVTTNRHT
jgi:hypothetical protein